MTYISKNISLIVVIAVAFHLVSCVEKTSNYRHIDPVQIEHIDGSEFSRLILTPEAVERLAIQTAPVREELIKNSTQRLTIPYSSVIYGAHGETWVYLNPEPLHFVRSEIKVDFTLDGKQTILIEGPPVDSKVVTVGAAELYGTEYEVGH